MGLKITDMPSTVSIDGTEAVPVVQAGVNKKTIWSQVATYFGTLFLGLTAQAADSAKLGGKSWVNIANSSISLIAGGAQGVILRSGGAHHFYRYSAYSDAVQVIHGYIDGNPSISYAYIRTEAGATDDFFVVNRSGSTHTFWYTIDVWE